uniref:Sorting nexin 22 n=1 Tax=Ailuropoda melanoleuca TaxID=9646 RepID=A0A7N5JMT4_AILME
MLEVHIPSVGPEDPRQSPEKGHMVFRVEVLCRGRRHTVQRRYSEFHALHKRIKKLYKVPDFPSKRLPNWRTRGLEQRRQGLETYIQGVLYLNQDVPKELLEFLNLRHFPTDPKASSWGALGEFLPLDSRQVKAPAAGSCCPLVAVRLGRPAAVRPISPSLSPHPSHPGFCWCLLSPRPSHLCLFGCLVILIPGFYPASPSLFRTLPS